MIFNYKVITKENKHINGSINADSLKEANRSLRNKNYIIIDIKSTKLKANFNKKLFNTKLNIKDVIIFSRQLSSLIAAAIPIDEALQTIMQDNSNKALNKIVVDVHSSILTGNSLYQALKATNAFDNYFIASIKSGEKGAQLAMVLEQLSVEAEKQYKFKKKISSALVYPVTVSIVAFSVIISLFVFVVPQITSVFINNNQALPPITIKVMAISEYVSTNIVFIVISFIVALIIIKLLFSYEKIKYMWHKILAKVPVIGNLIITANATRFARALAILHSSGIPMVEALKYALEVIKFLPMKQAITISIDKVSAGSSIYLALKQQNALPAIMLYMIASGEKSSNLFNMLVKAADNGEYDLDNTVQKIISIFEPAMILFMGIIVLLIVVAVLLPIFEMNNAIL